LDSNQTTIDDIDLGKVVELSRNLFAIDQTVADLYHSAMSDKLPCGYAWTTITLSDDGWQLQDASADGRISTKEGQALTGDVKKRVQAFATTHPQLIVDVLIDEFFAQPQQDKILNEWRHEHEDGVELDQTRRTLEGMTYDDAEAFDELRIRRHSALEKITGNPLVGSVDVSLGTVQWHKAAEAITMFKNGCRSILADLCARFGKTIWSGVVADMTESKVIIVTAYVKTVFTSFRTDYMNKRQFLEQFVHVNTEDANWKEQIDSALASGKRVISYVSLCQGNNRQDRINHIGSLSTTRLWIVDEADFGAHQKKQVDALKQGIKEEDLLLLMTGTNPDIAVRQWSDSRKFKDLSCTYAELLLQKEKTKLEMLK
jgi:hypothetical protein